MDNLNFFDAHCYVGRYKTFLPGSFYWTAELIEQMDHYGISDALVTHAMSREHHPVDGNAAIMQEVEGRGRLHPCWALFPPGSGEMPKPELLIPDMLAKGVKAVRLFYEMHHLPLSDWCWGEVLAELEAHQVPTFIDPDVELACWDEDKFDWDGVDALCGDYPDLTVILSEARMRSSNRLLYQLLDLHENLRVEISGFWAYHGIEFIAREFGADRLLFGTRMPVRDPASAVGQVIYSDISDEDKRLIAGDNLRALLGGVVE